ncbi:alpha/beta fold hydrolase [Corynebacterium halotolerans]|uniref:Abhydrolase domain-containing protein 11 n=1 Tax=Corynebacterium halotolerans YIM 70093 = DSM 44683 TaxID=1121362 RepID=M1NUV3_9CORY|nr:alpha/beta hydrolase [Corynebacterium halotolerans]AGF73277.1 Abhydrolase domain-containing protein 11 [Corynebacterium halotolerans YIM 70093 = DSM 44683]
MSEHVETAFGDTVAFDRYGGQGPGLLFVAGAGPWRETDPVTTRTAELLAEQGIAAIVYDRLGRGESQVEGIPITLDREVAAVEALLGELPGPTVLCGHSSGTAIGLYAAGRGMPVAGLALWEGPLSPDEGGAVEWAVEFGRLLDARDLTAALRHFMRDIPVELVEMLEASASFPVMVEQVDSQRPDADALAWAKSAAHEELFGSVSVPVLAMVGEQTYPELVEGAEWIAGSIPDARWKRVPGAYHTWEPGPMAAELAQFVRTVSQAG